jgi:hypothetical protein
VKKTEKNLVKRIAHARTLKFVFFVFFNIPDTLKVLKARIAKEETKKIFFE